MTRKDYVLIAEAFRKSYQSHLTPNARGGTNGTPEATAVFEAALELADSLKADNPRFDRNRFADAIRKPY
jgi:hypothetical protein